VVKKRGVEKKKKRVAKKRGVMKYAHKDEMKEKSSLGKER